MSRSDPQVNFRMPAELKAKLEAAAAENRRSTTAELVARLEASFIGDRSLALESAHEERLISAEEFQQRISGIIRDAMDEVLRKSDELAGSTPKAERPAIPTKGPEPRGKHPKG